MKDKELGIAIGIGVIALLLKVLFTVLFTIVLIILSVLIIYFLIQQGFKYYVDYYFKSEKFLNLKTEFQIYIDDCNQLNSHIENLKYTFVEINSKDYGSSSFIDNSFYNYNRPHRNNINPNFNIYYCSPTILNNANNQPIKYLCKYFNIDLTEETLERFESVLNNFAAVEQGKIILQDKRNSLISNLSYRLPSLIYKYRLEKVIEKLGFQNVDLSDLYFPIYSFQYISPGGNSSLKCDIKLDVDNLDKLILYLNDLIKFQKSVWGQRLLMTSQLREKIKKRDNFTCQICSNSSYNERNLLLEIDHIIPVSLGGLTIDENLQTLCWKCNRSKGSKLI